MNSQPILLSILALICGSGEMEAKEPPPAARKAALSGGAELAEQLEADGRHEVALSVCEQLLLTTPDDGRVRHCRGRLLTRLGQYEKAERDLLACSQPGTPLRGLAFSFAMLYRSWGRRQAAHDALLEHLALEPEDGVAWNMLGILDLQEGHLRRSQRHFEKAESLWPDTPVPTLNLALLEMRNDDLAEALDRLEMLVEGYPDFPSAHLALARLWFDLDCSARALDELRKVVRLTDGDSSDLRAEAFERLAVHFEKHGDLERALTCFEAAVLASDAPLPVFDDIARLYDRTGRGDDAVRMQRLAVELGGRQADRFALAQMLERKGQNQEALDVLRGLHQDGGRQPRLLGFLSRLEERSGEPHEAQRLFQVLQGLGDRFPILQDEPRYQLALAERHLASALPEIASTERGEKALQRVRHMARRLDIPARAELQRAARDAGLVDFNLDAGLFPTGNPLPSAGDPSPRRRLPGS